MSEFDKCYKCSDEGIRCQIPAIPLVQGRLEFRGEGRTNVTLHTDKIQNCVIRIAKLAMQQENMREQMRKYPNLEWQGRCLRCVEDGIICQNPQSSEIEGVWGIPLTGGSCTPVLNKGLESIDKCPKRTANLEKIVALT